jgi:hypothetical protein
MIEQDNESFEAELRRLKPARLPDDFQARLELARPRPPRRTAVGPGPQTESPGFWLWLRWLAPATAAVLVLALVVARNQRDGSAPPRTARVEPTLKADEVVIDRKLLASFDTVANLPDGEPVRFRCREWVDAVTLRDSGRGVEVEQRTPRLEVVPVSFETY